METRTYTEKSNARRAARAAGVDPNLVIATDDGFTFTPPAETNGAEVATITDDTWPHHADGHRKKIGEMTHAQQVAVAAGAVARLTPEFAALGVALKFKGDAKDAADDLVDTPAPKVDDDIPAFCKLSPEDRKAAWVNNPPKAAPIKETIPMAKAKTAKSKNKQPKVDKTAALLSMLKGKGATVEELTKATGWLAHTLRARLSGLAKPKGKGGMGLKIERERVEGVTTYRVAP